jgi:hypothetical protein
MKANSLLAATVISLSTLTAAIAAPAANPYPAAYDATYTCVDNHQGTLQQRFASNGTGRSRKEMSLPTGKTTIIVDYPTKTAWTIIEKMKVITKGPWKGDTEQATGVEIVNLGERTVDGHVCKGARYAVKGGIKTEWNDKVTKIMVQSVLKGGNTERQTDLTAYTAGAPDPSLFVVPTAGYSLIQKPQ